MPIVAECCQGRIEGFVADTVLDDVPDVALVNELVLLGHLAHHLENDLLAVARELLETLVSSSLGCACRTAHSRGAPCCCNLCRLTHESCAREHSLLADAVRDKHLK